MAKKEIIKKETKKNVKIQGFKQFGKTWFNMDYLSTITETQAIKLHKHIHLGRVVNAWKQANNKK